MTDRYAVMGNPIRHSMSPEIHRAFAREAGDDIEYTAIECPRDGFTDAVRTFREAGGRGLNVTAPFKQEAFRLAERRSERAEIAGSVNTLRFDGPMVLADNFDGVGARERVAETTVPLIERIHVAVDGRLPVAVGFGVSSPQHVRELAPVADGIIVGSAIVAALNEGGAPRVRTFVAALAAATAHAA